MTTAGCGARRLPGRVAPVIGRRDEVARLRDVLEAERLVTLTGPGGVGKSTLATVLARDVFDRFAGAVMWADLAAVPVGGAVAATVLAAVGGAELAGRASVDAIVGLVSSRPLLLVLDNCEHVVDRCGELVGVLLGASDGLTILATSQEPLRVEGEVTWAVPTLPIEDAMALLVDRAGRARPRDAPGGDVAALTRVCERLDGLPLALELAAARLRVVSPQMLADELDRRFAVLRGGSRTSQPRHRTLQASIEWSHGLLSGEEQRVFRRLGAFVGAFPLDAAEVVGGGGLDPSAFDAISGLVDRSLVMVEEVEGVAWYRLLESLRAYALDQLTAHHEHETVRADLARWVADWCASHAGSANQTDRWLADLRRLAPTIRAALGWSQAHDTLTAARVLAAARPLWTVAETGAIADRVLAAVRPVDELVWARCVGAVAEARMFAGDLGFLDEVVPMAQEIGERAGDQVLVGRCRLARVWLRSFDADTFADIAASARQAGARYEFHVALGVAAISAAMTDAPRGRALYEEWGTSAIAEDGRTAAIGECQVGAMVELLTTADLARHETWTSRAFDLLDATVPPVQRAYVIGLHAEGALYRGDHATLARIVARAAELDLQWEPHAAKIAAYGRFADVASGRPLPAPVLVAASAGLFVSDIGRIALSLDAGDAALLDGLAGGLAGRLRSLALGAAAFLRDERDADDLLRQALDVDRGFVTGLALALLAGRAIRASSPTVAVRVASAADAHLDRLGFRWRPTPVASALADAFDQGRQALGDAVYETATQEGRRLGLVETIDYCRRAHGPRRRPDHGWASLTPTERQVVALVAQGLSNAAVAQRLLVGESTVKTHLVHVFRKLAVTSRTQLVALAATQEPGPSR